MPKDEAKKVPGAIQAEGVGDGDEDKTPPNLN
jgi:hypothetical protein